MSAFRLASVLRLRRTLQEQCEVRAAAANRAAIAAEELAARREEELRAAGQVAAADASAFNRAVTMRHYRVRTAEDAQVAASDARSVHRQRIDELVRASMSVSALERLEERTLEAMRAAERVREMREIDDLVTARFANRAEVTP